MVRLRTLYDRQNRTRQHYATLPGSAASYGECTQTRTFKNHVNQLVYLANWPLYIAENSFQGTIKCQCAPLLCFAQPFSVLIGKKLPEWAPTKTRLHVLLIYQYATACMGTPMICLHSIKSSLPSLYPVHHSRDKLFQALYLFSVLYAMESWAGPGNEWGYYTTRSSIFSENIGICNVLPFGLWPSCCSWFQEQALFLYLPPGNRGNGVDETWIKEPPCLLEHSCDWKSKLQIFGHHVYLGTCTLSQSAESNQRMHQLRLQA